MEQLSGLDSLSLYAENENVHQHVSAFGIYDSSTCAGSSVRFRDLLAHFKRRLTTAKIFRRRLLTVPHGLDRPYWVDDPDVDIEFHVRHIALPQPGDRRQLMIQLARLHSRALDLGKPLWEIYVIEGLDNVADLPAGCFAIFLKVHQAALDGAAAVQLIRDLHSSSPDMDDAVPANEICFAESEVRPLRLYSQVVGHGAKRTLNLARLYAGTLTQVAGAGAKTLTDRVRPQRKGNQGGQDSQGWGGTILTHFVRAPQTRFNVKTSPHRVVDAIHLPMEHITLIGEQTGNATINDIYLATVAGALRTYLKAKNELPEASLRMLLSLNDESSKRRNARVRPRPASLFTDIRDPLTRLAAIQDAAAQFRRTASSGPGANLLPALIEEMPNFAAWQIWRRFLLSQVNCLVANVHGPSQPMYMAGARALSFCPIGTICEDVGLNVTGFSHDGRLAISFVACRSMMPDPAFFADCLQRSFDELCAAAQRKHAALLRRRTPRRESVAAPADAAATDYQSEYSPLPA